MDDFRWLLQLTRLPAQTIHTRGPPLIFRDRQQLLALIARFGRVLSRSEMEQLLTYGTLLGGCENEAVAASGNPWAAAIRLWRSDPAQFLEGRAPYEVWRAANLEDRWPAQALALSAVDFRNVLELMQRKADATPCRVILAESDAGLVAALVRRFGRVLSMAELRMLVQPFTVTPGLLNRPQRSLNHDTYEDELRDLVRNGPGAPHARRAGAVDHPAVDEAIVACGSPYALLMSERLQRDADYIEACARECPLAVAYACRTLVGKEAFSRRLLASVPDLLFTTRNGFSSLLGRRSGACLPTLLDMTALHPEALRDHVERRLGEGMSVWRPVPGWQSRADHIMAQFEAAPKSITLAVLGDVVWFLYHQTRPLNLPSLAARPGLVAELQNPPRRLLAEALRLAQARPAQPSPFLPPLELDAQWYSLISSHIKLLARVVIPHFAEQVNPADGPAPGFFLLVRKDLSRSERSGFSTGKFVVTRAPGELADLCALYAAETPVGHVGRVYRLTRHAELVRAIAGRLASRMERTLLHGEWEGINMYPARRCLEIFSRPTQLEVQVRACAHIVSLLRKLDGLQLAREPLADGEVAVGRPALPGLPAPRFSQADLAGLACWEVPGCRCVMCHHARVWNDIRGIAPAPRGARLIHLMLDAFRGGDFMGMFWRRVLHYVAEGARAAEMSLAPAGEDGFYTPFVPRPQEPSPPAPSPPADGSLVYDDPIWDSDSVQDDATDILEDPQQTGDDADHTGTEDYAGSGDSEDSED